MSQSSVKKPKDESVLVKANATLYGNLNKISYKIPNNGQSTMNPADNSLIEIEVAPEKEGLIYLHVMIGNGSDAVEV